ncbi:MAG: DUF973 family protein [Thermoplasmataceae archaeon]
MTRLCPTCGSVVDDQSTVCPVCGLDIKPVANGSDISGILYIRIFAIISLIVGIVGIVETYTSLGISDIFTVFQTQGSNAASQLIHSPDFLYYLIISGVSLVVSILEYYVLYLGYARLSRLSEMFRTPKTGSIFLVFGLILVIVSLLAILPMIPNIFTDLNNLTFTGSELTGLIIAAIVLLIGAIMLLVGVVLAVILGMHRISHQFNAGLFDAAMVLYILSFLFSPLSTVAAILALLGCNEIIERSHTSA